MLFRSLAASCLVLQALAFPTAPLQSSSQRLAPGSRSSHARRVVPLMARKPFIAGNWKLNPGTLDEATALAKAVSASPDKSNSYPTIILGPESHPEKQ